MLDYQKMMSRLLTLPSCTLIATGRTGSDFFHSLLDSHPQVLTFNGPIRYYAFWETSVCVRAGQFSAQNFLEEFIGRYLWKFKSVYDVEERKDQLGEGQNQSIDIDLEKFKAEAARLLEGRELNSKNTLVAIYAAYALCLGQDLDEKTLFFHHEHTEEGLPRYLEDFPNSRIICMTRDPRANFVSGIEHWRSYEEQKDCGLHLIHYTARLCRDADGLKKFPNPYIVIRVEDLGNIKILEKCARWLGIPFLACMTQSTWGGLLWHGDRLSQAKVEGQGLSRNILKNKWEDKLSGTDKYVFNFIFNSRCRHYGYPYKPLSLKDKILAPFVILWPLKYEWRFWSWNYLLRRMRRREYRMILSNGLCYFRRGALFFRYGWRTLKGEPFQHPFLKVDE